MTAGNRGSVLVVGAGAAGLSAALFALRGGARVTLLEKNEKPGKKLYITGKGRCNLSNACGLQEFLDNVPRNPRFLHSALAFLPPEGLRELLKGLGCPTRVERGRRVFPESDKASDVTRAFLSGLAGCDVRLQSPVSGLVLRDRAVVGVELEGGGFLPAGAVILATGGFSHPQTGSTGDGFRFAAQAGHRVHDPLPALVPLLAEDFWIPRVQGLSLRNVVLSASLTAKPLFSEMGELLFTHYGLSGPLALRLSSRLTGLDLSRLRAWVDLKPALKAEQLEARLQRDFTEYGRKALKTLLPAYLPASLAAVFPDIAGVSGEERAGQVTAAGRAALAAFLKRLPLTLTGLRPLKEAVVTRGGVDVRQVDPSTLASRLCRGLYFAGELLDVDACTGGYNLHIAFSTGALAGHSAALAALKEEPS